MKQRVLVVEDDAALARVLRDNLCFEGYEVKCVADGNLAIDAAEAFVPDLVLLDLMLPGRSGFDVCRTLRRGRPVGLLILTARSQKRDKLQGLNVGADDYVTKPFDLQELMARIRAVLRRGRCTIERISLGAVVVDFQAMQAWNGPRRVELTHREFELLHYLAERQESVVHRDELLHAVWGYPELPHTRSVDHAIARLRKKIERDVHHPQFVHTVHGDGYLLTTDEAVRKASQPDVPF